MMTVPPAPFRAKRKRAKRAVDAAPPVAPLQLTEAFFDAGEVTLLLSFDRAVDMAGFVASAISVNDPQSNDHLYAATGDVEQVGPVSWLISLSAAGPASGTDQLLNAAAGNGIVAVDDGGTWPGATDLELPFP